MTDAGTAPPQRSSHTAHWLVWPALGGLCALAAVAFYLWGTRGPAYLLDLIAAYCF